MGWRERRVRRGVWGHGGEKLEERRAQFRGDKDSVVLKFD